MKVQQRETSEDPAPSSGEDSRPSPGPSEVAPPSHAHVECGARERVWLPRVPRAEASAAPHPYCVTCGAVKNLAHPRGRPITHYLAGLGALKAHLERSSLHGPLLQVQSHRIARTLAARREFEDSYATPGEVQRAAYAEVVRSVRPDLDEELILALLPGRRPGAHRCRSCQSVAKFHEARPEN